MGRIQTIITSWRRAVAWGAVALGAIATLAVGPVRACDQTEVQAADAATPAPPRTPRPPHVPRAAQAPETPSLLEWVTPEAAPVAPEFPDGEAPTLIAPRGWFGFGFQCGDCLVMSNPADSAAVWQFGSRPSIYSVDLGGPAARAGFRRGDVITHLDGISILTSEGGRRFGAIRPGQTVRWAVLRDGTPRTVVARAAERPERRERVALTDLRRELSRLNDLSDLDQLRRELTTLNQRIDRVKRESAQRTRAADALREQATVVPARRLRYAGVIGGTEVEVRGPGSVIVSENDLKDELVINTGEAVVVIRVTEGLLKKARDKRK